MKVPALLRGTADTAKRSQSLNFALIKRALDIELSTDPHEAGEQRELILEAMAGMPAEGNRTWALLSDKVDALAIRRTRD